MAGLNKIALPDLDKGYPALIVKANRGVIQHGAVGIARTLGRMGVPVYAVVDDWFAPLAQSRYVARAFSWNNWPCDQESFLRQIEEVAGAIGRKAVLFPIDDLSAAHVAENAESLRKWFLVPQLPSELPRRIGDKGTLYALCRKIGISCAQSIEPKCERDIDDFASGVGFPIVMKAASQWAPIHGYASTLVVHDARELQAFHEGARRAGAVPMVVQEYLPGEDWIYHAYCNVEAKLCISFTGRKLLSYPLTAGPTVVGLTRHNEALVQQGEKLLSAIGFSGIVDMDWRYDVRDNRFKILDCNPRIGQNFRMFVDEKSVDVVRAQFLDLTGRHVERARMVEGRMFIVEPFYSFLRVTGRYKGADRPEPSHGLELAWLASDDPWPAAIVTLRLLQRVILRAMRRLRNTFEFAALVKR